MDHAHVGVTNAFLAHRLLFEGVHEIFEAICALFLVVHHLFGLKGFDHAADVVLVRVLERVVLHLRHDEVFCNPEVFIPTVELGHMFNQIARLHLNARQGLSTEVRLRHFYLLI